MSTMTDAAAATQEQFLATVRQSQQAVVEAVAAWAKAVEEFVPPAPGAVPGPENLPTPEAVVENAFNFAQNLLDAQRDFARDVIAASAPVLERTKPDGTESKSKSKSKS